MDYTDSRIIFRLLKNPRESLSSIASDLDISAQDMNYRVKKIKEDGIIKRYMLHVNPAVYGKNSLYLAFQNDKTYPGSVSSIIKCLEKIVVYGFSGTEDELHQRKKDMEDSLGTPVMEYRPKAFTGNSLVSPLDLQIINVLRNDPMKKSPDISRILDVKSSTVEKRIDRLRENKLISIIPKLDLSKINIVILGIFTTRPETIEKELDESFFVVNDRVSGISLSIEKDIYSANSIIQKIKKIDKNIETMVIYDYDFFE
ncbi:MAG: winged helix-turn-helix transcriptional regulator [Ferroplasma sp.]|uniref:winged helix-turn-helix transcriptional regulator n=1 Tax=Ferroplasma sp. TaxID=2591003 RepID=UPI0028151C1E|nr:winged helix-turn-helix transcriptional regulator [Ferroplasma sp.]WMT50554.1 MAG: winged helix-turn-helix transcriptional regulator [Ferroplasma sp.]